jgi:hypothetical protein
MLFVGVLATTVSDAGSTSTEEATLLSNFSRAGLLVPVVDESDISTRVVSTADAAASSSVVYSKSMNSAEFKRRRRRLSPASPSKIRIIVMESCGTSSVSAISTRIDSVCVSVMSDAVIP